NMRPGPEGLTLTVTRCTAAAYPIPFSRNRNAGEPCKIDKTEVNGGTVSWCVTCATPKNYSSSRVDRALPEGGTRSMASPWVGPGTKLFMLAVGTPLFAPESKLAPMGAPPSDAPCARERGAWLQPDQSVSGPKCVRAGKSWARRPGCAGRHRE